jgi:hypothetical protein
MGRPTTADEVDRAIDAVIENVREQQQTPSLSVAI